MSPETKQGSFFEHDEDPYQKTGEQPEQDREFGPEVSNRLRDQLETFKRALSPSAEVIYYPCSQNDTTISKVFPNSRIIYADNNPQVVKMLKEHDFEAVEVDATQYEPDKQADIVLLLNPAINPDKPASVVKEGGYLVCNNYHDTANTLHDEHDFELVGVVVPEQGDKTILDKESLGDYFTEIDTDEELQSLRFSWGNLLTYSYIMDLIKRFGEPDSIQKIESGTTSVMDEYKNILRKLAEKYPPIDESGTIVFTDNDGVAGILETKFPPKKGVADDLFVFKKKTREVKN